MGKRNDLEELIYQLTENAELGGVERSRLRNRFLIKVSKLEGLYRSRHIEYLEALDKTFEWLINSLEKFKPTPGRSVEESLTTWINGYLRYRVMDLYIASNKNEIYSLDQPISSQEKSSYNWLDEISNANAEVPVLSGLEAYIERIETAEKMFTLKKLEEQIKFDRHNNLKNCHLRNRKNCNCQMLSNRLLIKDPPDRFPDISREFDVNYQTLKSHWERKCKPCLREIYDQLNRD